MKLLYALAAIAGAAVIAPASAAPVLQYQILDGSTVIGSGSTTSGNILFSGSDSRFTVVSGTAASAPMLPTPQFSSSVFSLQANQATTAATLTIRVSATGLTGYSGGNLLNTYTLNSLNGNTFTSGTISTYFDDSNIAYGTGTLLATNTFAGLQQFSSSTRLAAAPASVFSETAIYTLDFAAGGMSTVSASSQISTVTSVPEPAGWAMMILGFGAIGAVFRRWVRANETKFDAKIKRIEAGGAA